MRTKGFKKITMILGSLGVAMMAQSSWAMNQEDSSVSSSLTEETLSLTSQGLAEGKAILGITDAKAFLGLKAGGLSQEPAMELAGFSIELSPEVKDALAAQILKIEKDRSDLFVKLDSEALAKKKLLKKERREIQTKRIESNEDSDAKLAKSLFTSLVREAAIDAQTHKEVALFDETNSITLSFIEIAGVRHIQGIQVGLEVVWKLDNAQNQWGMR